MTTFVGISGPIFSGKSTLASLLQEILGDEAVTQHTADPLKEICASVFGRPLEEFYDRDLKEASYLQPILIERNHIDDICALTKLTATPEQIQKHMGMPLFSPRHMAQYIGTDVLRDINPDIHVMNMLVNGMRKSPDGFVIVPDVRFENEHDAMDVTLYVLRPEIEDKLELSKLHESEQALPYLKKNSLIILNDGNLQELTKDAQRIADKLRRGTL